MIYIFILFYIAIEVLLAMNKKIWFGMIWCECGHDMVHAGHELPESEKDIDR